MRLKHVHMYIKSEVVISYGRLELVMCQTMLDVRSFQAKNRVFEFSYQKLNMLESDQC